MPSQPQTSAPGADGATAFQPAPALDPRPRRAAEFRERLLRFINETLPRLDRRRTWPRVDADTPLFESGLLDSLSILHLLAAVETLTGRPVPDHLVLMKHFRTVNSITATFCTADNDVSV